MAHPPQVRAWGKGLAVAASALALTAVAATPSALAASTHASDRGTSQSGAKSPSSPSTATTQPQPTSTADQNAGGANGQCTGGAYCSTRDGTASGNGNGGGKATGKPCAGCVGKADNKNPPGQMPNGSDANAGYECDRNHGVGRTNPAHTGCASAATDCTATPTAPACVTGGSSDCTTTPTAPACVTGGGGGTVVGSDCTTTPAAPGCVTRTENCATLPDLPGCVNISHECGATMASNLCTSVLGEKFTRTPRTTTTTSASVLGETVTRAPSGSLPFTGLNVAWMTVLALVTLMLGVVTARVGRRRTNSSS